MAPRDRTDKFLDLLQRHPRIQNQPSGPNLRVVGILARDRALFAEMGTCASPSEAFILFSKAAKLLSTHAKQEITQFCNNQLLIDGRIDMDMSVS